MSSPIADLTYRNYDGPLEPLNNRWWSIAKSTMYIAFKKRSLWVFMLLSAWYYVAMIFVLFFIDRAMSQMTSAAPGQPNAMEEFMSRIVWKDQFVHGFQFGQICYFIIALIIGAGTIANDNRANALLVYLSKPIGKRDYVLGKWFGVFLPLLLTMIIPPLVFFLYGLLSFREKGFISQDAWVFPKILFIMPVAAAFHSSLVIGVSSLFDQGRLAGSVYATIYFLTNFFTQLMTITYGMLANADERAGQAVVSNLFYASVDGLCNGFLKAVLKTSGGAYFGIPSQMRYVPYPSPWLVLPIVFVLSIFAVYVAYRKVSAVKIVG
jgi:ABC-2 type transport system permease protein